MPRITISISEPLLKSAKILAKRNKYRSLSELVTGHFRYDGTTQKQHHLSVEWAALTGYERDRLDAAILKQVESGEGIHGSWFEARIDASVKKHLAAGQVPTPRQVATDIARDIAESAGE